MRVCHGRTAHRAGARLALGGELRKGAQRCWFLQFRAVTTNQKFVTAIPELQVW